MLSLMLACTFQKLVEKVERLFQTFVKTEQLSQTAIHEVSQSSVSCELISKFGMQMSILFSKIFVFPSLLILLFLTWKNFSDTVLLLFA